MRNILFLAIAIFSCPGFIFSQSCNINPLDTGFISPPPDSLPCIERGVAYNNVIQISMPVSFDGIIVLDSLVVSSIDGLPSGINYGCNSSSCVFYGGTNGCISFTGTTTDTARAYPLTFNGYAVVTSSAGTHTYSLEQLAQIEDAPVPVYELNVINQGDSCNPALVSGVRSIINSSDWRIYPNPNKGVFEFQWDAGKNTPGEFLMADVTGQIVYSQKLNVSGFYKTTIDAGNLAKGLYIVQLRTAEGIAERKISIE